MAISTYDELKTAIADWMHRTDLTSKIPDFIRMGESFLNSKLRTVDMETRATATTSTTSRFMALPDGFLEMRSLIIQDPVQEIYYMPPRELREYVANETETGVPEFFTIKDDIEFNCIPKSAYTLEQHYYKKYDIATDLTNWLLTNHDELYLTAALVPAAIYTQNSDLLAIAKGLRDERLAEVNRDEARKRGSGMAYLRADTGLTRSTWNINTGP